MVFKKDAIIKKNVVRVILVDSAQERVEPFHSVVVTNGPERSTTSES